ncbi:DUF5696 domain-containing protein [Candidatus Xianfuyuplasma coldseepsis]|uniref:Uncharacterized protein n=1 Tax=Candidatus Xianfuyuplasma coldseepsis TaxID=2782163 RepID=A0A7L7KND6_9MOLU|nr:DUF5696 domain-containing protein [Xianfuyuplasma coldseepsis]QMS84220.1 hypothetical protein G4Z02_00175 [Xianfuyuplasma coldseepsis]
MMKKLIALLLLPAVFFMIISVADIVAKEELNYDLALGNQLSDITYDSNVYIEEPDKIEKTYLEFIPASFDKMAENEALELYLEEETLAIAVRVKENGYVYSSYNYSDSFAGKAAAVVNPIKSGVTIDLYKETTPTSVSFLDTLANDLGEDIDVAEATITSQTNGFKAAIDFNHEFLKIKFDLYVTIEDDQVLVNVPADSVIEYNEKIWNSQEQYYILRNIVLFPYFGSTKQETDGYVIIPDGSGALITLDSAPLEKASFSLNVYGSDPGYMSNVTPQRTISTKAPARVTMPLYAMIHDVDNTGFYVVNEQGANYAVLNFKSTGVINDYYNTYFSFRYRQSYEQYQSRTNEDQYRISFQDDVNDYDVTTRYTFLSGAEASYVGVAKRYQQDLLESSQLGPSRRKTFAGTPTHVDVIGAEIIEGILRLKTKEITTYQEITDMVKVMQQDGYSDLVLSLKTFNKDEWGYRFDVYRALGGRNDFREMIAYMDDHNIDFSYYLDYVRSYDDFSKQHAQTLSKRNIYHIELTRMFFAHLVNDTEYYSEFAENDIEDLTKYGIDGVSFNGFDRSIYTSHDRGVVYSSRNMTDVQNVLAQFNNQGITTGLYNPDAYLYGYMDTYYDAPISSSDYQISAASIPFLQLVIGGYVDMYSPYLNFISDETYSLMRMVEFGVFPSYVLTGGSTYDLKHTNSSNIYISEYDVLESRIATYYDFIDEGLTATIDNEMVDHTFLDTGVVRVDYADGTYIILNYNTTDVTVDTLTIEASSYVVGS